MDLEKINEELILRGYSDKDREFRLDAIKLIGSRDITVLGIDQGYANLGHSIIKYDILEDLFEIKSFGTINTSANLELNKRIFIIYNDIKNILNENSDISIVGCERLFFNKPMETKSDNKISSIIKRNKSASIMKTNLVTGILYLLSAEFDMPIKDFAPTTVKKHIAGSGKAKKEELESALNEFISQHGIKVKTNHESDSIGIGITTIKDYLEKLVLEHRKQNKETKKTKKAKTKTETKKSNKKKAV